MAERQRSNVPKAIERQRPNAERLSFRVNVGTCEREPRQRVIPQTKRLSTGNSLITGDCSKRANVQMSKFLSPAIHSLLLYVCTFERLMIIVLNLSRRTGTARATPFKTGFGSLADFLQNTHNGTEDSIRGAILDVECQHSLGRKGGVPVACDQS